MTKLPIAILALMGLLFASTACRSMGTPAAQAEAPPVFLVSFTTPESPHVVDEALLVELEELLIEHVGPLAMTSKQTADRIAVAMSFRDVQSSRDAGEPTAVVIQLFSAAHPEVHYDDTEEDQYRARQLMGL